MAKINKTKLKDEAVHGGNWLYDFIMQTIEPDLLSSTIGTLDEKYAGESATDRNARLFRYKKAFEDFDQQARLDPVAGEEGHLLERRPAALLAMPRFAVPLPVVSALGRGRRAGGGKPPAVEVHRDGLHPGGLRVRNRVPPLRGGVGDDVFRVEFLPLRHFLLLRPIRE